MKSAYLALIGCLCGMVLFVSIAIVFQYTTVYKNLSFELRNGLVQAGEEALVPEVVCEMVACSQWEMEDPAFECNENGLREECEDVYMDKDEFFEILLSHLSRLKRSSHQVSVYLHAYHNPPFLAKVSVKVNLFGSFIRVPILVEEVCIES